MKAEKILSLLNNIIENGGYNVADVIALREECRKEIRDLAAKEKGGNELVRRTKLLNKMLAENEREEMRGTWNGVLNDDPVQCAIYRGYIGFCFYENAKIESKEAVCGLDLIGLFKGESSCDYAEFDLTEIKSQLAEHKALNKGNKKAPTCIVKVNEQYFDADLFIKAVECLGGNIKFKQPNITVSAAYFESENGKVILTPVRPPKTNLA